jgi:selenocysteine lyase/cysteine desulfurase
VNPIWKSRFPRAAEVTYLDTAAEGLPPTEAQKALDLYFRRKAAGTPARKFLYEEERQTISALGRMLSTVPENMALVAHASDGLNMLANAIPWREGDEILISDLEFPSNVLAWLRLRDRGVKVVVVPSNRGAVRFEEYASRIHSRTRLVTISQVSYKTGMQVPYLRELASEAHRAGALFCVDATQALGRVPVATEGVDFLVASTYKWLLGVHGLGVVYLAPGAGDRLETPVLGWYSVQNLFRADRFENYSLKAGAGGLTTGMPNFPSIYALRCGLNVLMEEGVERIDLELRPLIRRLRKGLEELGIDLLTPPEEEYASGIVSFAHPACERIGAELERQGVIVWFGDGRVRASLHLYNDQSDVDHYLSVLEPILASCEVHSA